MSLRDSRFALNLAMLDRALAAKGPQGVVPFIQVKRYRLMNGTLADAAREYGRRNIRLVVIRIRDLDCEHATREEIAAYVKAIGTFQHAGVEVLCDSTGRLGSVLVAAGAYGASAGDPHFRKVANAQIPSGGNSPNSVRYEVFGRFRDVDRGIRSSAMLPTCPIDACAAASSDLLDDLREHNLHSIAALIDFAASQPLEEFIALLEESDDTVAVVWAEALKQLKREIA